MKRTPVEIKRLGAEGLLLQWSDNSEQRLNSETLRRNCPCASCRKERGDDSHSQPLTPKKSLLNVIDHSIDEQLSLVQVWPVGNYAIGLEWSDGHNDGIYSFELLSELT